MKRIFNLWAVLAFVGCGSPSSASSADCGADSGADLSNFTGAAWTGTTKLTTMCGASAPFSLTEPFGATFTAQCPSGLSYTSIGGGCTFEFSVSGSTATLTNGPVMCFEFTYQDYTLTSSNGSQLSASVSGTFSTDDGGSCSFTVTIMATR